MARIQIPLDALTSRLRLGDRFNSVRSQSLGTRFANLRPVTEFFDLKRLSKPANFNEVQSRVNYNLSYFSSNYAVVFLMLSIYSLLTNLLLLFVIFFVIGGMWAIGKLEGRDLEFGSNRVSTSQLYTGLLVISVPLGIIASPFSTVLWLIGASGVTVLGFFWGGGLGGRPRAPKHPPSWGRPSGVRGRRRRGWEYDENRVEEIESEEGSSASGVGGLSQKHFQSDSLRFTGIDISPKARRPYTRDDSESEGSESDYDSDRTDFSEAQIALREKEEALVQSALGRIQRAQRKGKAEVKLNKEELSALERRRERLQAAARSSERRRRPSTVSVPLSQVQAHVQPPEPARRQNRPTSSRSRRSDVSPDRGPGLLVPGLDGQVTYAPIGGRPRSATSQPSFVPPLQVRNSRNFSDPHHPMAYSVSDPQLVTPLPHEEGWIPGARSSRSSLSSQGYSVDPFDYQIQSDNDRNAQYARRISSAPTDVAYSSIRRSARIDARHHSETLRSREESEGVTSSDDHSDGNGVKVIVEEEPVSPPKASTSRKPVSGGRVRSGSVRSRRKGKR